MVIKTYTESKERLGIELRLLVVRRLRRIQGEHTCLRQRGNDILPTFGSIAAKAFKVARYGRRFRV